MKILKPAGLNGYVGNKDVPGMIEWTINRIPPHSTMLSLFCGSGGIERNIYTGDTPIIMADIDRNVYDLWLIAPKPSNFIVLHTWYSSLLQLSEVVPGPFIYADPPYPIESRRSGREYYRHEMTMEQHEELLCALCDHRDVPQLIHSNKNDLYDKMLKDYTREEHIFMTRAGRTTEVIYYNYELPAIPHNTGYLGKDFTERQAINRKIKRISRKLQQLPEVELELILNEIRHRDK